MEHYDVLVIGGGPAGYTAAIRAAQFGLRVACVEKELMCGGTCLRVGCIPSKALLESSEKYYEVQHELRAHGIVVHSCTFELQTMLARKEKIVETLARGIDLLLKKNKVKRFIGKGRLLGPGRVMIEGTDLFEVTADHIILATGSVPASLPIIPVDGVRVVTSTEALSFSDVPEHLVVIGAGYIGLELGLVWHRLGARVTVIERLPRILPGMDEDIAQEAQRILEQQGLSFHLQTEVVEVAHKETSSEIVLSTGEHLIAQKILVAVGRIPYTEGLGLETIGVACDATGKIPVQKNFVSSCPGVYAIGDLVQGPMLAHKAYEEGIACVEGIVEGVSIVNYDAIPAVCYIQPEVACVGKTEESLRRAGVAYTRGVYPFAANGRAHTLGTTLGRVKVLADTKTDRLLGVHVIGPRAGEIIAEAAAALTFGASSEDVARTCHAHPTLAEAFREAALAALNRAIHI